MSVSYCFFIVVVSSLPFPLFRPQVKISELLWSGSMFLSRVLTAVMIMLQLRVILQDNVGSRVRQDPEQFQTVPLFDCDLMASLGEQGKANDSSSSCQVTPLKNRFLYEATLFPGSQAALLNFQTCKYS